MHPIKNKKNKQNMHIKTIGVNYNYIVVNLNLSEQKKA